MARSGKLKGETSHVWVDDSGLAYRVARAIQLGSELGSGEDMPMGRIVEPFLMWKGNVWSDDHQHSGRPEDAAPLDKYLSRVVEVFD